MLEALDVPVYVREPCLKEATSRPYPFVSVFVLRLKELRKQEGVARTVRCLARFGRVSLQQGRTRGWKHRHKVELSPSPDPRTPGSNGQSPERNQILRLSVV
jgi:hypothetical protein